MAECLLDLESNVVTVALRTRNLKSESKNGELDPIQILTDEDDYSEWEWESAQTYKDYYYDRIPCWAEEIINTSEQYISEIFEYLAEDEGDKDDVSPSDLDRFLDDRCDGLRDWDDMGYLLQRVADWKIEQELWDEKYNILRYYAFNYWITNYSIHIPKELASYIEDDIDYYDIERLDDIDDKIEEWLGEHDGIMDFCPDI